ncbi:hypothetical protein OPQ81_006040 [Rhizoctonia solani]|nr:hypothetical protein OPQ81_006040 [Rhizoctonia solani]
MYHISAEEPRVSTEFNLRTPQIPEFRPSSVNPTPAAHGYRVGVYASSEIYPNRPIHFDLEMKRAMTRQNLISHPNLETRLLSFDEIRHAFEHMHILLSFDVKAYLPTPADVIQRACVWTS